MILKFVGELCVMKMRNDEIFEGQLICQFKIYMRNLTNFDTSSQKSNKMCILMGFFRPKYMMFELKKAKRSYLL